MTIKTEEQLKLKNKINDADTDLCRAMSKLEQVGNDVDAEGYTESKFVTDIGDVMRELEIQQVKLEEIRQKI